MSFHVPACQHRRDSRPPLRPFWTSVIGILLFLSPPTLRAAPVALSYAGSQTLPEVIVDGRPAAIHTQGLFVTDTHFYVTGRLERSDRRALFLAFNRDAPNRYDVVDITPPVRHASDSEPNAAKRPRPAIALDHPGGFDSDGRAFWIPVAASRPRGPTAVVRLEHPAGQPPLKWRWHIAFRVDDHIGALAYSGTADRLYGANWDTRRVYAWSINGTERADIAHTDMVAKEPDWCLAVQDWKGVRRSGLFPPGTLVAGGIDKAPDRNNALPSAVVEWLDPVHRKRLAQARLRPVANHPVTPTREGLAWHDDQLYLLPSDLGRGATVLRYRCQRLPQQ